jgi:hypothetical protein
MIELLRFLEFVIRKVIKKVFKKLAVTRRSYKLMFDSQ